MEGGKLIWTLIKRDIKTSKKSMIIRFGVFFGIFTLYLLLTIYRFQGQFLLDGKSLVLEVFKGSEYLKFTRELMDNLLKFPTMWMLINSFIIYAVGDYFYRDIRMNGRYLLIRVKKMRLIYIAKIIWSIFTIIIYYGLLIALAYFLGKLFENGINTPIDFNYFSIGTMELMWTVLILYSLTSITLISIFITLTLKIKPAYSFFITIILSISALYTESKLFIGQHSLILRHLPFDIEHNFTVGQSVIFNIILTLAVVFIGKYIADKKEVF